MLIKYFDRYWESSKNFISIDINIYISVLLYRFFFQFEYFFIALFGLFSFEGSKRFGPLRFERYDLRQRKREKFSLSRIFKTFADTFVGNNRFSKFSRFGNLDHILTFLYNSLWTSYFVAFGSSTQLKFTQFTLFRNDV